MERLTNKETEQALKLKENKSAEDNIYLKLASFENEQEDKQLFTKAQLNVAIMSAVKMLSDMIKVKMTREIILTLFAEIKPKATDGKVPYEEIEKIGLEIIKRIESTQ